MSPDRLVKHTQLIDYVTEHPGANTTEILDGLGVAEPSNRSRCISILRKARAAGLLRSELGLVGVPSMPHRWFRVEIRA